MAPSVPKNSVLEHFIHPGHKLAQIDNNQEYQCHGCKTSGTEKRYRCRVIGCDFDMHEYCATCPKELSSHMHKHKLSLVMRKDRSQRQHNRVCDVCADPVEGLFYRCQACDFDVHTLCTQLPTHLRHALHPNHPLNLESLTEPGSCAVCKRACGGWRYGCATCKFDIHFECVLTPVVLCPEYNNQKPPETNQRRVNGFGDQGIPYRPPPQFEYNYYHAHGHGHGQSHGYPYYNPAAYNCRPDNMYYNQQFMDPANFVPQYHHPAVGMVGTSHGTGYSKPGKSMFALVGELGFGVLSNMIFGVDFVSLFSA